MSLRTRARRIQKETGMSYQQVRDQLMKLRLYPEHDHIFIQAHTARYTGNRTCEECRNKYPVGFDKKGLMISSTSERFCPACFAEQGTTECLRCSEPLPGHGEKYCDACEDFIDSQ
jgi:hypothetical protein